jgi:hypothetical protein
MSAPLTTPSGVFLLAPQRQCISSRPKEFPFSSLFLRDAQQKLA